MTTFITLGKNGAVASVRVIQQSSMLACPHCIMVPEHYRDDGSCRCNDSSHVDMKAWGYRWDRSRLRWV